MRPADRIAAGYYYAPDAAAGKFDLLSAPLGHLSHLIASFADVAADGQVSWKADPATLAVKARFPGLKLLLAVGGWTGSGRFSQAAGTELGRRTFAASALTLMERHGFDGLDIDWEFPVTGGLPDNSRSPADRETFTLLLEELRSTFDGAADRLGRRLLLTAAMGAGRAQVEALETDRFHRHLDWLNLMTYDFHGSWNPEPGDNSSLADTEASVRLHLDRGFPAEKLVVGTPLYAHQWSGPAGGPWTAGPVLFWNQAEALRNTGNFVWDAVKGASRLEDPGRTLTWDSAEALDAKAALVRRLGLGGLMTWQVAGDPEGTQLERLARIRKD